MPSVSKSQQQLMGMAYAVKTGKMPRAEASQAVLDLADSMTANQLKDFASTPHKNLPDKVEEYSLGSYYTGSFMWFTQAGQANVQQVSMKGDKQDPLIQTFIDYINGKEDNEEIEKDELKEGDFGVAISANPSNVPGMGNAAPPSSNQTGSGDVFGSNSEEEEEERGKVGIMSYEDYKKWLRKWQEKHQKHSARDRGKG